MPNSSKWIDKANLSRFWDSIKHRFTIYEEQTTELMSNEAAFEADVKNRVEANEAAMPSLAATAANNALDEKFGEDIADNVTAWLDEHVDPDKSPVVIDDTLTISGAAADSKTVGDRIGNLKGGLRDVELAYANDGFYVPVSISLVLGTVNKSGDVIVFNASTTRQRTDLFSIDTPLFISVKKNNFSFFIYAIEEDGETIAATITSWTKDPVRIYPKYPYFVIITRKDGNADMSLDLATDYLSIERERTITDRVHNAYSGKVVIRGLSSSTGLEIDSTTRLLSNQYFPAKENHVYSLRIDSALEMQYSVSFYSANDYKTNRLGNQSWFNNGAVFITPTDTEYVRFVLRRKDQTNVADTDVDSILYYDMQMLEITNNYNYTIGSDFTKHGINIDLIGQVEGMQDFCKYSDKYYSLGGTSGIIYIQDLSFTHETQTGVLSYGHGNSIQLGHDGKAYISGWNDGNVYVLNLNGSQSSIIDTINLPVTGGYTTCVVDDLNDILYIFHKPNQTRIPESYNFIAWNYVDDEILLQKKTEPFAVIQGCDYYNGRIILLNGDGNNDAENGYRIYNTNGDVIGELKLEQISNKEPEGVFINRDSGIIEISTSQKNVYRLS